MKKRRKEKSEARIFSGILILSILIIVGFLIFSNWKTAQRRKELLAKIEVLRKEVEVLEEKNRQLKKGIDETGKESFWEAKVREQGYQKPGETAVVIKKEEKSEEGKAAPKSRWEKFLAEIKFWEK